jgi:hypothetical protein
VNSAGYYESLAESDAGGDTVTAASIPPAIPPAMIDRRGLGFCFVSHEVRKKGKLCCPSTFCWQNFRLAETWMINHDSCSNERLIFPTNYVLQLCNAKFVTPCK